MKTFAFAFLLVAMPLLFISCATQSVYLQQLHTGGPAVTPPLFVTNGNTVDEFRLAPRVSLHDKKWLVGRAAGHSKVNANGVYQLDTIYSNGTIRYVEREGVNKYEFSGRNFSWEPTRFSVSLDADYQATRFVSLVFGANYSSGLSRTFLGANGGVAFSFQAQATAVRIDIGAHWSSVLYDAEYAVATKPFSFGVSETDVVFFHEKGKSSFWNAYGAFTFNTKAASWPLQFFTQLAINRQTLVDLDRRGVTAEGTSVVVGSVSFFIVTPGVYFDLSPTSRLLLGLQLRDETELLEADPGVLLAPFVQVELRF